MTEKNPNPTGARTAWWYCGICGYANHPRQNQDTTKCEQCGASANNESAVDYKPQGA